MTGASAFAAFIDGAADVGGLPAADVVVAPDSIDDLERILDLASERAMSALVWGGGTHQGLGGRFVPDLVISMARLNRLIDWQPDDFTVTVEAGMLVADLEERLNERGQTAVLPEVPGMATVGGVMAAGVSGWRRLRFGPTRERVLEVDMVTGDGRRVRAGGRVVKNVTGFDLPRLAVGSFGALGIIAQTCLKLWPRPAETVTVTVTDGDRALATAYRPAAVVEVDGTAHVFLGGTPAEVDGQVAMLGGTVTPGWSWVPELDGVIRWSVRVPPARLREAITRLPPGWHYQAGLGVGEIRAASSDSVGSMDLRSWAEEAGGGLVVVSGPDELYRQMDPWGSPPAGLSIQRELMRRFDPCRTINPGRLAGGL